MGSSEAAHKSAQVGSGILGTVQDCKSSRKLCLADQRKATPPFTTEDEEADSATFGFSFGSPVVTVAAERSGPRRLGRIRRPRDFGPYNLY